MGGGLLLPYPGGVIVLLRHGHHHLHPCDALDVTTKLALSGFPHEECACSFIEVDVEIVVMRAVIHWFFFSCRHTSSRFFS